ncbi:hypothetical protein AXK61_20935 [Tsukamurella pseudospumae]|uniref:Uncharacterized protein n=1 Tax=Tsukamurella pseudospumae TaxID=239498 RepID=A0A137ZI19_9ACTN|nr:hypothetical protein AXK61_20935 [Tsukamurella pseudospumae]
MIRGLETHRSLTAWAYILHDRDDADDHYQFAIRCATARTVADVAWYLGVPEPSVRILRGRGAFPKYIRYLLHEGEHLVPGKAPYPREAVVANFDFVAVVDAVPARRRPSADTIARDLMAGTITIESVYEQWPELLEKHRRRFEEAAVVGADMRNRIEWQRRDAEDRAAADARAEQARVAAEAAAADARAEQARVAAEAAAHEALCDEWLEAEMDWYEGAEGQQYMAEQERITAEAAASREESNRKRETLQRRDDVIDMIAISRGLPGVRQAREYRVASLIMFGPAGEVGIVEPGNQVMNEDGEIVSASDWRNATVEELTEPILRRALSIEFESELSDEEYAEAIEDHRRDVSNVRGEISNGEFHFAANANRIAFENSLNLCKSWRRWPDLVEIPLPHAKLPRKEMEMAQAARKA